MNPLFKMVDGFFDRAASGLKEAMRFGRSAGGWILMPRTNFDYSIKDQGLSNSIILSVVGWAQRNWPQAPFRIRSVAIVKKKKEYTEITLSDTGPGAVLGLLENPNTYYDGDVLMEAALADFITASNAYIFKIRNGSGRVVELWWAPQIFVEPKWNPDDVTSFIDYYEYNPNGEPYKMRPEDVIHLRDGLDPRNPRKGLNKLSALQREVFTDEEAAAFSATILNNLGVPGVIISPKDTGTASRNRIEDPEGVKQKARETFRGDGRGDFMVMTAPTEVQVLSFSPQQLALRDLRRIPEERITGVFGLAAIVAGMGAGLDRSTFANFEEARAAAFEEFLIPKYGKMAKALRWQLVAEFADPRKHECDYDYTQVRVLAEDQNKLWTRALSALAGGGITRRAFKDLIGEQPDDNDDVYYIPAAVDVVNAEEPPPDLLADQEAEADPLALPSVTVPSAGAQANGNGNGSRSPVGASPVA